MKRILFLVEAATLAHVVRPLVLARSLDPESYEIFWACAPRYQNIIGKLPFHTRTLNSISSERFVKAAADGGLPYDTATIREYVKEEINLIKEIKPDVVVSDFRFSSTISTKITGVPCVTITSAYWSPYSLLRLPVPEHPLPRLLGVRIFELLYPILLKPIYSFFFALYSLPVNRVLREYGFPALKLDLRYIHSAGNYTLYADLPELVPTRTLPATHRFIGPLLWSPDISLPSWWDRVPKDKPIIYVSLGSSGKQELLPMVLETLSKLDVYMLAVTAGRIELNSIPANAFVSEYLPGHEAVARANLVICNGGSPTTYQALAAGKPMIGIPSNVDQYLNMQAICRAQAGIMIRSDMVNPLSLKLAVTDMLSQPAFNQVATALAKVSASYNACAYFNTVIQAICFSKVHVTQPAETSLDVEPLLHEAGHRG